MLNLKFNTLDNLYTIHRHQKLQRHIMAIISKIVNKYKRKTCNYHKYDLSEIKLGNNLQNKIKQNYILYTTHTPS